jgi:hypothetical protein
MDAVWIWIFSVFHFISLPKSRFHRSVALSPL